MLTSQMLRPNDIVRFDTPYYALAPIAGLQMSDPAVMVGDLLLVRCNRAEWETAERGYVFKDWHSQYYEANPVFLYKPFTDRIPDEAVRATFDELARDAARLITALRLYKTGHLLEPSYTVRFLVVDHFTHRITGPYRTEYLAMPVDGMIWPLEQDEAPEVGLVYENLAIMERLDGTEAVRAVTDQFNLSHTPTIPKFFAVHVLLTAMEVLLDGVSKRVALKTSRYDRALEILRWSFDGLDPAFEQFYQNHIHALRNAIHHHAVRASDVDLNEVMFRLQLTLMMGIRLLMRVHRLEGASSVDELKRTFGWQDACPKDILNGCLDRHATGDPVPLQLLMTPQEAQDKT